MKFNVTHSFQVSRHYYNYYAFYILFTEIHDKISKLRDQASHKIYFEKSHAGCDAAVGQLTELSYVTFILGLIIISHVGVPYMRDM